jgi:flagellar basal-body rod protein FlgC
MSISSIMNIARTGMTAQSSRLSAVADNIANLDTTGYQARVTNFTNLPAGNGVQANVTTSTAPLDPTGGSNVDPTVEMTNMIEGQASFVANTAAFETGADLWDVLLSIKRD